LFELLKEYEITDLEIPKKYTHPALIWYQKKHTAKLDGKEHLFKQSKPSKDWNEALEKTKSQLKTSTIIVE